MPTNYDIDWTDGTLKASFTVLGAAFNTTSTSLVLPGRDAVGWGEQYNENLVRLLENFASNGTEPVNPTIGQLWFDASINKLKVYFNGQFNELRLEDTFVVRQPTILYPTDASTIGGTAPLIIADQYYAQYGIPQLNAQFQISTSNLFGTAIYDTGTTLGPVNQVQVPGGILSAGILYYVRCRFQNAENAWSAWSTVVSFTTGSQAVATPSIVSPASGTTNIDDGVTLAASSFSMTTGTDTQSYADWEVWTGANGTGTLVFSSYGDSSNLSSIDVPTGTLAVSTTYHPRVRYAGVNTGSSDWSADTNFTMKSSFTTSGSLTPGGQYGGGYYAGTIAIGGSNYALIVSPKTYGEQRSTELSNRNVGLAGAMSVNDGKANTDAMMSQASPQNNWQAAYFCATRNINGYTDWYLPARDELELLYRNLKATANNNKTGTRPDGLQQGQNANSVPVGAAYTTTNPAQSAIAQFQQNGSDAVDKDFYWSSTTLGASDNRGWQQRFGGLSSGEQRYANGGNNQQVRAVRKVKIA